MSPQQVHVRRHPRMVREPLPPLRPKRGVPYPFRTITPNDVRRPSFRAFGQAWPVVDFMGEIQPRDVGKRVYLVDDIVQVENDEQFRDRMRKQGLYL